MVAAVKFHSEEFWNFDEDSQDLITLTKVDVAIDMAGSFIPQSFQKAYGTYSMLVSTAI